MEQPYFEYFAQRGEDVDQQSFKASLKDHIKS